MPPDITEAIRRASYAIRQDPYHDLLLGRRREIYRALGKRCGSFSLIPECVAQLRRANLARLSIEKVLPFWEKHLPQDKSPRRALRIASQFLAGTVSRERAERERDAIWGHCDDFTRTDPEILICVDAGYGAAQAISVALDDEIFEENDSDAEITDRDIDPYDIDAACSAASVYAGGPVWVPTSDPVRRQMFWEWWLEEGISSAWQRTSSALLSPGGK